MRTAINKILTTATLCMLSSSALAAYTGHFLVGIEGGYSMQNGTPYMLVQGYPAFNVARVDLNNDLDNDGGIAGAFAGYEVSDGFWFAGLEASISVQDVGETKQFAGTYPSVGGVLPYAINLDYSRGITVGVSGRVGAKAHEWVYPYVRLGVEGSKDKVFINGFTTSLGNVLSFDDRQYNGRLLLGAGLEVPFHPNISVRAEYNYSTTNGTFAHVPASVATGLSSIDVYHKPNNHVIKAAITWKFI